MERQLLTEMFGLQKDLLVKYIPMENLPSYPISLVDRGGVKLLQRFLYRTMVELGEAFDEYAHIFVAVSSNRGKDVPELWASFEMELADAWHFILEFMIYSGMDDESDLVDLAMQVALYDTEHDTALGTLWMIGHNYNIKQEFHRDDEGAFRFRVNREELSLTNLPKRISSEHIRRMAELLWHVSDNWMAAVNSLKLKDWNQVDNPATQAQLLSFYDRFMRGLIVFMQVFAYLGLTEVDIYRIYRTKNEINKKRIEDGY